MFAQNGKRLGENGYVEQWANERFPRKKVHEEIFLTNEVTPAILPFLSRRRDDHSHSAVGKHVYT